MSPPIVRNPSPVAVASSPLVQKLTSSEGLTIVAENSQSPKLDQDIFFWAQLKRQGGPVITNVEALREPGAQAALISLGFEVSGDSPSHCNRSKDSTQIAERFTKDEGGVSQSVNYYTDGTISLSTQTADKSSISVDARDAELIVSFPEGDGKKASISNQVKATGFGPI